MRALPYLNANAIMAIMCKNLAELLGADEPLFSIMLEQLERASGRPSVDVRLLAEIVGKVHLKTKALGLDPHDTTGPELYRALQDLTRRHDTFLATKLGVTDAHDVTQVLASIKPFIDHLPVLPRKTWALKHSAAKRLIKQTPPKQVMKQLRYRSIDSMLKREHVGEIFGAIRFIESPAWQRNFVKKYSSLTPLDFETRDVEIIFHDSDRWSGFATDFVRESRNNIISCREVGTVHILPLPVKRMAGISLLALTNTLQAINEVRLYSSYFKMHQVSKNFGVMFQKALLHNEVGDIRLLGNNLHWRTLYGHLVHNASPKRMELFEPHLQPDDLEWRKVEETLYRIEPALHFWYDMDFVAAFRSPYVVSFNLIDNATSFANQIPYKRHTVARFKDSLSNEIMMRYAGQPKLEDLIMEQLGTMLSYDTAEALL